MSMKQVILIVGSGGGGVPLVQSLQKQINLATHRIVVVEKRDFYAHWPALIRASVTKHNSIDEAGLIPLDRAFDSSVQIVRSSAKQITPTEVIVESGERIPYAQLVLATGSIWNGALALPDKKVEALDHFRAFRKRLEAADNVAIIGGGAVGIEYSGELRHFYPHKKVTLTHALDELVNDTYALKFRQSMLDAAAKTGVEVILGDRVPTIEPVGGYLTTEKGRRIQADFVIAATGGLPNNEHPSVVSTLDPSVVNESGRVVVTPELSVKLASGARNVWAIGDIIEWPEQKMVFKASTGHAPLVASNIIATLKNTSLKPYAGKIEGIFVTLGPNGGRGVFPVLGEVVLGDWAVSKAKSADLFLQSTRAALGYGSEKSGNGALLWGAGFLAVPIAYALYSIIV